MWSKFGIILIFCSLFLKVQSRPIDVAGMGVCSEDNVTGIMATKPGNI